MTVHNIHEMLQESESQRQVRAHIELRRDRAAEQMYLEHDEMEKRIARADATPRDRLNAATSFARALALYLVARKELELCGWDAGPWPDWYESVMGTHIAPTTPKDRVCMDCGAKHWEYGPLCAGCRDESQREQRRY